MRNFNQKWIFKTFESLDSSGGFSAGEMIDDTGAAMKFDSQEYYPYVYCRIAADIIDSIWDLSLHYSFTRPGWYKFMSFMSAWTQSGHN